MDFIWKGKRWLAVALSVGALYVCSHVVISCDERVSYIKDLDTAPVFFLEGFDEQEDEGRDTPLLDTLRGVESGFVYEVKIRARDEERNITGFTIVPLNAEGLTVRRGEEELALNREHAFSKSLGKDYEDDLEFVIEGYGTGDVRIEVRDKLGKKSSRILRITTLQEIAPKAVLVATLEEEAALCEGAIYRLDASGSEPADEGGSIIAYEYVIDKDTVLTKSNELRASLFNQQADVVTREIPISLRVFDNDGVPSAFTFVNVKITQ